MQATLRVQAHKALFDQEVVSSFFPAVHIYHISAEYTCSYCMWGYMENFRLYTEALERGERVRPTKFKLVPGGNHFLHCDAPELLLREIIEGSVAE
ncbi:hypothetical protein C8F04DRAFT_1079180 [Mycena alexandri]|uniref:Uncharacterized protein n=1 Tax=Mycena alexandri TaxID=1745969 RepID=A0AAD6X9E7_9AGAR|nr:hypothetical protein C8F04DRAFT_1079180 [Mycena alexandri]